MEIVCGVEQVNRHPLTPYSEVVCDFLDTYSKALRGDAEAKAYPDVMTFAFWTRRGNIGKKKEEFLSSNNGKKRVGRGVIFHISPSNVPVNCMFTYAFGLLAGNSNVVRIPTKNFPQIDCMLRIIEEVLKEEAFSVIKEMTSFVKYDRTEIKYSEQLSSACDVRVIWGGDDTINSIRQALLPPRSTEITFADRYSFGIVSVDAIMKMSDDQLNNIANGFYNDTYLMDQNACSTPHLICFRKDGLSLKDVENARLRFWNSIFCVAKKYSLDDIKVSDKYTDLCDIVMSSDNAPLFDGNIIKNVKEYDNLLYVCELSTLPSDTVYRCRGRYGMFFEYEFDKYEELNILSDTKVQTCAVCGVDNNELRDFIIDQGWCGIDRIVPFGSTLDIDVIWDGYDIISSLSRVIY